MAEVAFEDFAQAEIRRLEELRLVALETRIDADLQLGRTREVVGELEALLAEHPTRERLASQLMLALYRCGRQADALEVYQRTRAQLAEELGLEPGPALRTLQMQILAQAPSLKPALDGEINGSPRTDPARAERPRPQVTDTADRAGARTRDGLPIAAGCRRSARDADGNRRRRQDAARARDRTPT